MTNPDLTPEQLAELARKAESGKSVAWWLHDARRVIQRDLDARTVEDVATVADYDDATHIAAFHPRTALTLLRMLTEAQARVEKWQRKYDSCSTCHGMPSFAMHIHPATWQCQSCGDNYSDMHKGVCAKCWAARALLGGTPDA